MGIGLGIGIGLRRHARRSGVALPVDGAVLWLSADVGVTTSGADVTEWRDQSGEGNDYTAAANRPEATTLSDLAVIYFDSTGPERMTGPNIFDADADYTFILVLRPDNVDGCPWSQTSSAAATNTHRLSTRCVSVFATHEIMDAAGASGVAQVGNSAVETWHVIVYRRDSDVLRIEVDGQAEATGAAPGGAIVTDRSHIAAIHDASGFIAPMGGYYAEVIAFPRALTDEEVTTMTLYAMEKWEAFFP